MAKLDILQKSYLFRGLNAEQLQKLDSISREETFEAGRYIFREGDPAQCLHVVEEGKVQLQMKITAATQQQAVQQTTLEVITGGRMFGWSALIKPHVFTGSAQAVDKCKVVTIDGTKLRELMDSDPRVGYEIMCRLSEVVANTLDSARQMLVSERGLALLSQIYGKY